MATASPLPRYKLYIGGKWVEPSGRETFPAINPFTQKPWAEIAQAGESDVIAAIAAARKTFETSWRKTTGLERGKLLFRLADLLEQDAERMGRLETTDNGKVIRETTTQMAFAARQYRFYAGYADKIWGKVIPLDRRDVFDYKFLSTKNVMIDFSDEERDPFAIQV